MASKQWMLVNGLKLNDAKTDCLVICSRYLRPKVTVRTIPVGYCLIEPSLTATNLGVIFDRDMTLQAHAQRVCQTCYARPRNISSTPGALTIQSAEGLIHALISSRLDFCNSLLARLPEKSLKTKTTGRPELGGPYLAWPDPLDMNTSPSSAIGYTRARGGSSSYTLCTGNVPPSRVCFSQFLSGKGAVFSPIVWQGYVFDGFCLGRVLFLDPTVWQGVCFDPGFIPKFWARVVILPFFLGRVGNFCLGRVRVCHPGLHTPIHKSSQEPPPPPGGYTGSRWPSELNTRSCCWCARPCTAKHLITSLTYSSFAPYVTVSGHQVRCSSVEKKYHSLDSPITLATSAFPLPVMKVAFRPHT